MQTFTKEVEVYMKTKRLLISALFLALGIVLPFLTGQIKEIGDTLLPMHIPVMLCGIICGWKYGLSVGLILPFLRSVMAGMPPIYPNAVWMSAELATYGLVIGLMYSVFGKRQLWWLYCSLVASMISGRIVWGVAKALLLGIAGKAFTIQAFIAGGFVDSLPGIVLQLVLVPVIVKLIDVFSKKS